MLPVVLVYFSGHVPAHYLLIIIPRSMISLLAILCTVAFTVTVSLTLFYGLIGGQQSHEFKFLNHFCKIAVVLYTVSRH